MDPFQMLKKGNLAAKGGPAAGLGNADDNHRISKPYTDTQTRIVAKGRKTKKKK
jgi:hypothetical protein